MIPIQRNQRKKLIHHVNSQLLQAEADSMPESTSVIGAHHQEHLVISVTVVRVPQGLAWEQLHRVFPLLAAVATPF